MAEKKIKVQFSIPNPWLLSTIFLLFLMIALFFTGHLSITGKIAGLTPEQAGEMAIDYINNNLVQPGTSASLISVEDLGFVYRVITSYQGNNIPVFITKDGSYLFLQGFETAKPIEREQPQQPTQQFDAPDREKPNVKFFVMSFCPFGNIAEAGLAPVFDLLGEKVEWEPHYVIYSNYGTGYPNYCLDEENKYCSMHGIQELNQDVRELCVWEYYPHDLWWDWVLEVNEKCNSRNADTCWEPIAEKFGINIEKIKDCQLNEAISLLEEEVRLNQLYNVRGSPTLFINDRLYRGDRSPEAYKQAICSGFITQPSECLQTLSTEGGTATGGC
jgi:hypothetical protein